MILRKPYALLIKNFKTIHLALLILMSYIVYVSGNILKFFNDFIASGTFTRTSFSLSSNYVNIYMFLVAFFIASISLIIYILMRQKKKPKLFYLTIIMYYLGIMVFFFYIYNTLGTIEVESLSPRSIRVIRDVSSIVYYVQYLFIVLVSIRAVGFNIKKFNFGEDLQELEIDVTDNEEFELTVGIDPNKIRRRIRKSRREIKYFIIENFFVLMLLSTIVVTTIGITIFLNVNVYNKIYKQSELFRAGAFVNKVEGTYYTNLNQRGDIITSTDKTFVILNINFNNKDITSHTVSLDNINLIADNKILEPITNLYQSFTDLGVGYIDQVIKASKSSNYIFVFQVDKDTNFSKLYLRYRESLTISPQKIDVRYRRIKLEGIDVSKIKDVASSVLGDELSFKNTALGKTILKISDVQIEDKFIYDATNCYFDVCSTYKSTITLEYTTTAKSLMKLSSEYKRDIKSTLYSSNTLDNLINSYGYIRYTINNKTYDSEIINRTPADYRGGDLYYQVPTTIKNATKIDLVINIRDKQLVYKLK